MAPVNLCGYGGGGDGGQTFLSNGGIPTLGGGAGGNGSGKGVWRIWWSYYKILSLGLTLTDHK